MTEAEFTKHFHKKLVETFKKIVEFLNHYNIRWWVCGGTAIGVIRHRGFIPWDDDIDIFVLREDYEKLFSIREALGGYGLKMKSIEDGPGYPNGFIKIFDANTTLWERREFPDVVGVYVDVFPIERSDADMKTTLECMREYRSAMKEYRESISYITISLLWDLLKEWHLKTFFKYLVIKLKPHNKAQSYSRYLKSTRLLPNSVDGKYMVCVLGSYKEREYLDASIFSDTLKMPFESIEVNVPVGYGKYLTQLYGDYMQLPPIEKQVSHHDHYYCNFSEGLTLEQVKERIRRGQHIEL